MIIPKKALIDLHVKRGWSYRRLAKRFGYKIGGICYILNSYGIKSNYSKKLQKNKKLRDKALLLIRSGKRTTEVTRALSIGITTLHYWMRAAGLKVKRGGWKFSKETLERINKSRPRGESHHRWKGDLLLRKCSNCLSVFRKPSGRKNSKSGLTFCSMKCSKEYQIEERHPCWKGGSPNHRGGRYTIWARAVVTRDNKACKKCGSKKNLNAHHIKPWKKFPDLRFEISNGLTLCVKCHREVHSKKLRPWVFVA